MRIAGTYLSFMLVVALTTAATAAPTELKVPSDKAWKHKATGIKLPVELNGLKRTGVTAFGGAETDVGDNYWSAEGSDNLTIYLYRNVSGSVPVWFDRARSVIQLLPEKYPNARGLGIRPFAPRGQVSATGLMEVFTTDSEFKATALVVLPINGFYAKVRASSSKRDAAGLEQLVVAAVNSLDWASRAVEVSATPVVDCPAPLPSRPVAEVMKLSAEDSMMAALIGGITAQAAVEKKSEHVTYCREPGPSQIPFGVYRPVGTSDRFMIAILDAGKAVFVGDTHIAQILSEMKKPARVSVTLVELERTSTFADFKTLPQPQQAIDLVNNSNPISAATTWGDKRDVIISTGQKEK